MVRNLALKQFLYLSQRLLMKAVASINNFLEVSELLDRSQNGCEFSVVDTAVVKNDSVDELVEMLECLGESVAVADA